MKKLAIISAIAMSGLFYNTTNAQIGIRVGIHLFPHRIFAPRPVVVVQAQAPVYQEPVVSENDDCDFYYLPDVGAYYSVDEQCYYYLDGDNWISAGYLPGIYHDFDWRYARRFEINQARPYLHNDFYRNKYKGFDRDIARNHDDFRGGFDYRNNNNYAYNYNGQRFDNKGGYGQHSDNNRDSNQHFDNRRQNNFGQANAGNNRDNNRGGQQANQNYNRGNNNGWQANQNQNRGNRDNQQRIAQNNNGYNGHNNNKRDRF